MTVARLASLVALVAVAAIVAIVLVAGRGGTYTVTADMVDAGQLVKGNAVRIGGADVGTVSDIDLLRSGSARITMKIDDSAGRLPRGTTMTVRLTSQSGSASRYVVLTPGDPDAPKIPDGGRIEAIDATAPVDFDALLDSLDPPTRQGLRDFINGGAQQYGSRSRAARTTLQRTAPALATSVDVLAQFTKDREALNRLIGEGSIAARAVAGQSTQLTELISNANTTAAAIGDESAALEESLALFPTTLRKGSRTLADLRPALDDLEQLVDTSKPATKRLAFFLSRLRPLLSESVPTVRDLAYVLSDEGADNDLVDLVQGLPALDRITARAAPRAIRAEDRTQDIIDAYRDYTPDIAAAVARFGQVASYYDANGHYIRSQPSLFSYGYDAGANELTPLPSGDRLGGLSLGNGARCPGGAAAAPDGSSPRRVTGCTP